MIEPCPVPRRPGVGLARRTGGLLLLGVACCLACRVETSVEETVIEFCDAVQQRDFDRLYCLSAGARVADELGATEAERRVSFARWAEAELEAYEHERDSGRVELTGHGIRLAKLFALGRGTFSSFVGVRTSGEDGRRLRARLRFGYDRIDVSRFSPGTTLYLASVPPGSLEVVEVPRGYRELQLEVLDEVAVEWTLVRGAPSEQCSAGWTVVGAQPVAGSERTRELTWVF